MGTLPALVMNMTGYVFCFTERRMQTSGVNDERIIGRLPANRWILSRATSTNVLMLMETGATPASTASWKRGYSAF
jgi:hypothetical protein